MKLPRLRIPEAHRAALVSLSTLDEQTWTQVSGVLAEPNIRKTRILESLKQRVPDLSDPETLVDVLISLSATAALHAWASEDVAETIADSSDLKLQGSASIETLRRRLVFALNAEAVKSTARAASVVLSHDRTFHTARVLTDIRPIFADDARKRPLAAAVTHTLRIDYFEELESKTVYITMDTADLKILDVAIRRAVEKAASLTDLLSSIELPLHGLDEGE